MIESALTSCSMERFAMSYSGSTSVVSRVFDAALSPDTRRAAAVARDAQLKELFEVLSKAARLQYELEGLRWKSSLGLRALDQLAAGVIVTDARGRVIEMNRVAETILRRGDALSIREHRLSARH